MINKIRTNPLASETPIKVYTYCAYGEVKVFLYNGSRAIMQNTATGWFYNGPTSEVFGFARAEADRIKHISAMLQNQEEPYPDEDQLMPSIRDIELPDERVPGE